MSENNKHPNAECIIAFAEGKQLQFFKSPWRGVRSHDTRTCGLHVHTDKAGMSLFHACKMVFFIHDSNNQKLIKDIERRANAD